MKKIALLLLTAIAVIGVLTHRLNTSTGTDPWLVIDSGYQINITPAGDTALNTAFSSLKAATKNIK